MPGRGGGDEGGLSAEGAGEDVIVVGVVCGGFDHGGPHRSGQRAVAGDHLCCGAAGVGAACGELEDKGQTVILWGRPGVPGRTGRERMASIWSFRG